MATDREIIKIQDFSSCDFQCSGGKIRVKLSSLVIDSTGGNKPGTYTAPSGTIPNNLKEKANVIEIFDDAVGYWKQTSCDGTAPVWELLAVVNNGAGAGITTTSFVDSTGTDSGVTPANPGTPPSSALISDTLIERFDDFTNYWTYDGSDWVLNFQDSNSENYNTYFVDNSAYDVPATDSDPPNPSGTNPSTNLGQYDTYVSKYATHVVYYTYNGSAWVEDFRTELLVAANLVSSSTPNWLTISGGKFLVTPLAEQGVSVLSGKIVLGHSAAGSGLSDFATDRFLYLSTFNLSVGGAYASASTAPLLFIGGSTGKIGLGTPTPYSFLDISKPAASMQLSDTTAHADARRWQLKTLAVNNGDLGFIVSASNSTDPSLPKLVLSKEGRVGIGIYSSLGAKLHIETLNTTDVGVIIQGISSQSGDLLQFKTNPGAVTASVVNFEGKFGIKTTTPTAYLHLGAGTATAGTAPIKLTSGTALSTIEEGALEFHTNHLYFSIGGVRYQLDQQLNSANNGVSFSGGVLQFGTSAAGSGSADYSANRYVYQGAYDTSFGGTFGTHASYPILYLTGATGRLGLGGNTSPQAVLDIVTAAGLGVTPTDSAGLLLSTIVQAGAGSQQISPPIRRRAYGWKTDATAASQSIDFQDYVLPIQGTASPSANWILQSAINGGAYANKLYYSTSGNLSLGTNTTATAKLDVKGTADEVVLVRSAANLQLLKVYGSVVEIGATTVPTNILSSKTDLSFIFSASASNESGFTISGTAQAAATASHVINGVLISPTLISGAATQVLTAVKINPTFSDVNSATKYIVDLQVSGSSYLNVSHQGKFYSTSTFTALVNNMYGAQFDGSIAARNTASDVLSGLLVTTALTANAAASQVLNGVNLTQTLTSNVTSHTLNGLNVDTTFSYTGDPARNIANFKNAGTSRLVLKDDGRLYGTALHNNAGDLTGTTNQYIASGTYTPTLSNLTNISASTAIVCVWKRTGNMVTVAGTVNIDTTSTGFSELTMTLPIASTSVVGGGTIADIYGGSGKFAINTVANTQFNSVDVTNHVYSFTYSYLIE